MPIDSEALDILRCPVTRQRLLALGEEEVITEDGEHRYPVIDGIFVLLPAKNSDDWSDEKAVVQRFYEEFGWNSSLTGEYNDTVQFVNSASVPRRYTERCNLQINAFLPSQGKYLLDVGSGPIPHPEYLTFHENFDRRVCVDFSLPALLEAKRKLGNRGIYVVADVTRLPLAEGAVEGAVCCHVLYHVPADEQRRAFEEIARAIAPGGCGIVVYRWADSPLSWRLEKLFKMISGVAGGPAASKSQARAKPDMPPLYFHPHTCTWFLSHGWSFRYRLACYRLIDNFMMRKYMGEGNIWQIVTWMLYAWQRFMPRFTGKYGLYPLIVIQK